MTLSIKFLKCFHCHNVLNNHSQKLISDEYCGLFEIRCSRCKTKWLVCPIHDLRWSRLRYCYAQEHVANTHQTVVSDSTNKNIHHLKNQDSLLNEDIDAMSPLESYVCDDIEYVSHCSDNSNDVTLDKFILCHRNISFETYSEKVRRFLLCESVNNGDGSKRLVASAFSMNFNSDYSALSWDEITYHMSATMFCTTLTSSQQGLFSGLCHMMVNNMVTNNGLNDNISLSKIPVSSKDIDRYYLKRSTSIVQNVPIPTVAELDSHAYVSITELIQYVLYFNIPIDGMLINKTMNDYKNLIPTSSAISRSKVCHDMRKEVRESMTSNTLSPLIVWIILWSDDFEPNHVKQHKKSTWIKTVTIAPPQHCQTSPKHTYVIALGPKDANHEEVHHRLFNELQQLKSPTFMYSKSTNSNIPIVVRVLAISADRPERCAINCMLGHGGHTSRRWRYSAYVNQKKLKSCSRCMRSRIMSLSGSVSSDKEYCSFCYDWDYSHPSMFSALPQDYPTVQHPNSPLPPPGREVVGITELRPIELNYAVMLQGVKFCFFNCYHSYWTKITAMTYLKSIGINEAYGNDNVYQKAMDCRRNKTLSSSSLFDHLIFPMHWSSGLLLYQCIDTPMHQLFQGVVKSIMELTMSWLTQKNTSHYKAFGDYVNNTLYDIHELKIDWCRMEKFMRGRNYTLGGWQAEQFVAFSRCITIVYGSIRDVVGDDEVGIDEH